MTEAGSDMGVMEYRFSAVDSQGNVQTTDLGNVEENGSQIPNQLSFTNDGNLAVSAMEEARCCWIPPPGR